MKNQTKLYYQDLLKQKLFVKSHNDENLAIVIGKEYIWFWKDYEFIPRV